MMVEKKRGGDHAKSNPTWSWMMTWQVLHARDPSHAPSSSMSLRCATSSMDCPMGACQQSQSPGQKKMFFGIFLSVFFCGWVGEGERFLVFFFLAILLFVGGVLSIGAGRCCVCRCERPLG